MIITPQVSEFVNEKFSGKNIGWSSKDLTDVNTFLLKRFTR